MTIPKVLLVGAAGAYALHRVRQSTARRAERIGSVPPPDPADPVQQLYSEVDPTIGDAESLDTVNETVADIGDRFGVHEGRSNEVAMLDEDEASREGQNMFDALQIDAVEEGPLPEHELEGTDRRI